MNCPPGAGVESAIALDLAGQPIGLGMPWWFWNFFGQQAVFVLRRQGPRACGVSRRARYAGLPDQQTDFAIVPLLVQPRLLNDPFSDCVCYLHFRFGGRAMLFDLGDISALSPREALRVTHVCVSHMHLDHFVGFDRLLRLFLYRETTLTLFGPPGLGDAVEAKLAAYSWNLLGPDSHDFSLDVSDWHEAGFVSRSVFRAREAFRRREAALVEAAPGVLHAEPEFCVEAAELDHGIASLAFALQETTRVNVHTARLDGMGLPVGPWLTEAKRAVRGGGAADVVFEPSAGRRVALGELLEAGALVTGPGQRVCYATDLAFTTENVGRLTRLARGADTLFIEAGFLDENREIAAARLHLTAAQAGGIARAAGVKRGVPMHFSARYAGREAQLRREFEEAFVCR